MVDQDYYELLGVPRGADDRAIKAAYRKVAMECHPDRHGGCSEKEAHFKAVSEAYDCPQGSAEARRLRPLRQGRVPEWRRRQPVRRGRRLRWLLRHLLVDLRRVHGPARAAAECGARRRPALRPPADAGRSVRRHRIQHHDRSARALRELQRQGLLERGELRRDLLDLQRRGQGPRATGLLRRRAQLPQLPRKRRGHRRSVPGLRGRRPGAEAPQPFGENSRRGRRRHAHPRRRRRRVRRARSVARAISTSSST